MEIKTRKSFRQLIQTLAEEVVKEEELEELTVTGNVDGYNTPFAFKGKGKNSKKKNKEISTNSTGYSVLDEAINEKDLKIIRKLIIRINLSFKFILAIFYYIQKLRK